MFKRFTTAVLALITVVASAQAPSHKVPTQDFNDARYIQNLVIGTVTTGAPGSSASASISHGAPNSTLNLTLPTGATGGTFVPGLTSDGNNGINVAGGVSAQQAQGELNGALYSSPEAAVAVACSSGKLAVWFPAGHYTTNGIGLTPSCSGISLRGVPGATFFTVAAGQTGLYNANASSSSPNSGVSRIYVSNIWWDITSSTSTVAWNIKGISWSTFIGNVIWENGNAAAIIEDGGNVTNTNGDYDNDFYSTYIYGNGTFPWSLTSVGISVINASNDNRHIGGIINRVGTAISLASGDHNYFAGVDAENWQQNCVSFGASAQGNIVDPSVRCETGFQPRNPSTSYALNQYVVDNVGNLEQVTTAGTTSSTASASFAWTASPVLGTTTTDGTVVWKVITLLPADVIFASGSRDNSAAVYISGYETAMVDNSGGVNGYSGAAGCSSCNTSKSMQLFVSSNQLTQVGINKVPVAPVFGGGLDLHGWWQSDGNWYSLANSLSNSSFTWYGQSVASGSQSKFPWFQYTSTNGGTDVMSWRSAGSISFATAGGTTLMQYNATAFQWQFTYPITPNVVGNSVGTAALAFGEIFVGHATNQSAGIYCNACTTNRTLALPDANSQTTMAASLTTTAATSDNVTIQGVTSSGHCSLAATNASAATNIATTYISAKASNQITVTHTATASMTYDLLCTAN